jgi:hypothetical protein
MASSRSRVHRSASSDLHAEIDILLVHTLSAEGLRVVVQRRVTADTIVGGGRERFGDSQGGIVTFIESNEGRDDAAAPSGRDLPGRAGVS